MYTAWIVSMFLFMYKLTIYPFAAWKNPVAEKSQVVAQFSIKKALFIVF